MNGFSGPIKDITHGIFDGPHATPPDAIEGPIFLGIKNLTEKGALDFSEIKNISEKDYPKWIRRVNPQEDDIVFTYEATLHRYALIPSEFRGCLGRRLALIRPNRDMVDPKFLLYYLISPIWRSTVEPIVISGSTVDRIPISKFPDLKIKIPSIEKQKQIVKIISPYNDLIENNRRRIQLLEEAARLLYQEWFVRLRFPGYEHTKIVDGVPEGWQLCKISEVCHTLGGGTPSSSNPDFWNGDVIWATPTDITNNDCLYLPDTERKITQFGLKNSSAKIVDAGTILMTSRASIGFFGVMDKEASTNQGFINIIPIDAWSKWYIAYNLISRVEEIRSNASGSTYKEISKGRFRDMSIILPTKNTALEFGEICNNNFEFIRALKNQQIKLQEARDLLLPRLMNGVIPV
nr:restriction endonuclease subunit S [uncultured Methanospirillum sp.]